ncbi:hypothetical protein B0O41_3947 [Propionibacteriaceae bacterium ES.041]|nr:hypothetical protein B0O41_3947 [Propionibacteriaceae bacterium ES.041]
MSATTKTVSTVAGLALTAVALTGCVVVEPAPSEADGNPKVRAPAEPVPTEKPKPNDSTAPSGSSEPTKGPSSKPKIVDLSTHGDDKVLIAANPAGGLLSPPRVVGSWLTYWRIDGDRITYEEVTCPGLVVTEATGKVGDGEVVWDDVDPWVGDAESKTSSMKLTDTTIRVGFTEKATTDVAGETEKFVGLCKDNGETVADFVRG